ncbi:MAG: hypothetical protein RLZZ385_2063 [Pseudomonadota bacterium]
MLAETEDELIRAARDGNFAAFGRLVRPLERQMLSLAAGIARDRDEANDIYQDALLAAFRGMATFKMESRFSTWLHRIVVNTALSRKRKLKRIWRQLSTLQQEAGPEEQYCSDSQQPEQTLLNAELNRQLTRALTTLTEKERLAFVLCHQQEYKLREAAEMMDCSENSIKTFLFRARAKLREQLQPYYRQHQAHQDQKL